MDDAIEIIAGFILVLMAVEVVCFAVTWLLGIAVAGALLAVLSALAACVAYLVPAVVLASRVIPVVLSIAASAGVSYLIFEAHGAELVGMAKFQGLFSGPYDAPLWLNYSGLLAINLLCVVLVIVLLDREVDKAGKRGTVRILASAWWLIEELIYVIDRENRGPYRAAFRCLVLLVLVAAVWPVAAMRTDFALVHPIAILFGVALSIGMVMSGTRTWRRMNRTTEERS